MREVAAEFERPVMLYSIGKDSSAMLHLAQKSLLSVETAVSVASCRYHLEISRNDRFSRPRGEKSRMELLVHINKDGLRGAVFRRSPRGPPCIPR